MEEYTSYHSHFNIIDDHLQTKDRGIGGNGLPQNRCLSY